MRVLRLTFCAVAIAAFAALPARADEWNKQTILTFSAPVQVPGATLPAGTYQFKLADLQSNRHVVQIFDKDGTKLYTTILAIPDERLKPSDKPVVMFSETAAGTPSAVKAWFYPGDTIGNEFVYPRTQAVQIAKATNQPVLSRSESSDMKTAEVARVDQNGNTVTGESAKANEKENEARKPAESTTANARPNADQNKAAGTTIPPATTTEPSASRSARANSAVGTSGQANPDQNQPARRSDRLPKTASPLALYELVSGLAFAGAYGVRRLRQSR